MHGMRVFWYWGSRLMIEEKFQQAVKEIAEARRVEDIVSHISHRREPLPDDLKDLCQEVYLILLDYPKDKVVDMWECGDIDYFIVNVVMKQLRSDTSAFYYKYRKYNDKKLPLNCARAVPE